MARVTAILLRDQARAAMLAGGGRGFMRFLPEGGALLTTDAARRCAGDAEKQALVQALRSAGFGCDEEGGLLLLTPEDALLGEIAFDRPVKIDWTSPLHPVQALGLRWSRKERRPLTGAGRQLVLETLRLCWKPPQQALEGLEALCARAAVMQRMHDVSGLHEAGAVLLEWCDMMQGGHADEA